MSDLDDGLEFELKGLKLASKQNKRDEEPAGSGEASIEGAGTSPGDQNVLDHTAEAQAVSDDAVPLDAAKADEEAKEEEVRLKLPEEVDSELDSDSEEEGWKQMEAIASFNVYNDKGELELRTYQAAAAHASSQEALPGSGRIAANPNATFGYTKIVAEEQAQRSQRTNRKTDFLFDHKALKQLGNADASAGSSVSALSTASDTEKEKEVYDEFEEDVEPMSDVNADSQLNVTKNLLGEMEKYAYVGAVSVLANQMCTELAELCLCVDIKSHRKLAQRLQFVQKDTAQWKSNLLNSLYEHLQISEQEIRMVEKLSMHGVRLEDLCRCLKTTQDIENPFGDISKNDGKEQDEKDLTAGEEDEAGTGAVDKSSDNEAEDKEDIISNEHLCPKKVVAPENVRDKEHIKVDVAWTIICDLFLILLRDASYDARSRTLLQKFANILNVSNLEICEFERRVTNYLDMEQSTENQEWNEVEHMKERRRKRRRKKMCYVGLAMVGGSLILGLSGGLLAPVIGAGIAAGLSTIGIGGATGFLTGAGGTTVVALTSTAIGGNIGAKGMRRRMGSVRTFEFRPLHNNRRLNLMVSVSGWMIGNDDDVRLPYSTVDPVEGDLYALHWEPEMLKSIGQTINIVANELFTQAVQQVLGATILTAFISAIQWPMGLSKLGYILDNPWSVSLDRAWAAGLILADTLMSRNLGQRPVTLMGFSLGSRVIFSCLVELSRKKALGLVENVFIFGTPVVKKKEHLVMARSAVSGRFVNAFSGRDWMLAYLFRAAAGGFSKVMGIAPIENIEGVENFDCTEIVDGHLAYRKNMPKLLKKLGIEVVSEEFVEIEETVDPEQLKRKRQLINDVDAAHKKLQEKKKHNGWVPRWLKPKKSKWRTMVEDAVEEGTPVETVKSDIIKAEEDKLNKKDNALVDHGALMRELQKIKAALREEQLHSQNSADGDVQAIEHSSSTEETAAKNVNGSPPATTPRSPNNFQLLSAGRPILPEDDDIYGRKKDVVFNFSDDF
ncbi:hypothetical protein HG537_0B06640 [Torulaspora globosa]|uniref:DUF726-domain-containing protein n=1 Tax=Torulaspora globosa TaxID=48254 RepID=A0A7H9HQ30_9SACH|nr:hypothetical protein HG537_0B06640 [Torulaspora sp. CBS 2947]